MLHGQWAQPALCSMRDINRRASGSKPCWRERRRKDAAGRQVLSGFPHGETRWQKTWLGLLFVCPRGVMAVRQGPLLVTVSIWRFYSKPSFFHHLSRPAAWWICQDSVPDPLLALPHACRQGSMSSSGTTASPMGDWAAYTRWPTSPSLRAPERHLQSFTAQQFCLGNCNWQ